MAADRYRVEVLVLRHLNSSQDAKELNAIRDYSAALDFLTPVAEEDDSILEGCEPLDKSDPEPLEAPSEQIDPLENMADVPAEEEVDPNAVIHVAEMGAEMQDAWRRLRLSGPYRPLQFLSWEQGSEDPFPELRIHDLEVVLLDDPYADLREIAIYEDNYADDTARDIKYETACIEAETDPFPEPTLYYALDGTVSLKRSRFLHLNLDLQLREADTALPSLADPGALPAVVPGYSPVTDGSPPEILAIQGRPERFLVHALEQSRQVRSARMEYFDGPVISVLAWITTIPLEESTER